MLPVEGSDPTRHAVQPIRFAAIDPGFEVHAIDLRGGEATGGEVRLGLVEADRRRLVARVLRRGDALEPIGVCSLISSRGRLLIGHRRAEPQDGPGSWELVASAELDEAFFDPAAGRVDFRGALLARLAECVPLDRPQRARLVPFALAHDVEARHWQVCLCLELAPGPLACVEIERATTRAYDAFRFVRPVDVIESGPDGAEELARLSASLVRLPRVAV